MSEPRLCEKCGKNPVRKQYKICDECKRAQRRKYQRKYYAKYTAKSAGLDMIQGPKPKPKRRKKKPMAEIADINAKAREARMTYGQYVAMMQNIK